MAEAPDRWSGAGTAVAPSTVDDTPVDAATDVPISSNWAYDHEQVGEHSEIKLTPKATSSGEEGTVFYDSDDKHLYVGTE